ncbi:MAG: WecB/TagA/CpsF family glycosyltransferase [Chthoniobacterales bacterium]
MATQQILGLRFFDGTIAEAVDQAIKGGGLIVAPSATCFARLTEDAIYRRAVAEADMVLPDSGFMVLLWRLLQRQRIKRISGLAYLSELLRQPTLREVGRTFWIFPNESARDKGVGWLTGQGFRINSADYHVAPIYGAEVVDEVLARRTSKCHPRHIIIGLAGGVQEKLGAFLRKRLHLATTIHCVGGAMGFLTGDQIGIPDWADRLYLGWLFRLFSNPRKFLPRLWRARVLPGLILNYGKHLPSLKGEVGRSQKPESVVKE